MYLFFVEQLNKDQNQEVDFEIGGASWHKKSEGELNIETHCAVQMLLFNLWMYGETGQKCCWDLARVMDMYITIIVHVCRAVCLASIWFYFRSIPG